MIFLPPLQMSVGEDFSNTATWFENGVAVNFTGWSGSWSITRAGTILLTGTASLDGFGHITTAIPAASVNTLVPFLPSRGFILPGTVWAATLTNGTDSLSFNAAIQLFRNKTTVSLYSGVIPGWVL